MRFFTTKKVLFLGALIFGSLLAVAQNGAGRFEAEGKSFDTKFVRVLYAAEGSEKEGEGNSVKQLIFDSKDPKGNAVKVYRFQIVTKNTGYDEVQTTKEEDFKLKKVENGAKIHIEVPVENGKAVLEKAYIGNLAYNFGTRETRNILTPENVKDIDFKLTRLDLPVYRADKKPGDKGIIYNEGFVSFTLTSKAKHISSEAVSDFKVKVNAPISITHIRGKERANLAVNIEEGIVKKNI